MTHKVDPYPWEIFQQPSPYDLIKCHMYFIGYQQLKRKVTKDPDMFLFIEKKNFEFSSEVCICRWNPFDDLGHENQLNHGYYRRIGKLWLWPLKFQMYGPHLFKENVTMRIRTIRAVIIIQRRWRARALIRKHIKKWIFKRLEVYLRPDGKFAPRAFKL